MWTREELLDLAKVWGQIDYFSDDTSDEFQVRREDGRTQGIFKSWSVPTIPFLDLGRLGLLARNWNTIQEASQTSDFWQALHLLESEGYKFASEAIDTIIEWEQLIRLQPKLLGYSFQRALLHSYLIDRRLTDLYLREELSQDPIVRLGQLVNRTILALSLLSPFFNVEAVVAHNETLARLVVNSDTKDVGGGVLDAIAPLLPSCFDEFKGSPEEVFLRAPDFVRRILAEDCLEARLLVSLSRMVGLSPTQVWCAAQKLRSIPTKFAGRAALGKKQTLEMALGFCRDYRGNWGVLSAAANTNAFIRFHNWVTFGIIDGQVISPYGSLSATSGELLEHFLSNPNLWAEDFCGTFREVLAPQVEELDADSAKGRFLLHLIFSERKLAPEVQDSIRVDEKWRQAQIDQLVAESKRSRVSFILQGPWPRDYAGDKTLGLTCARFIAGLEEHFLPGWVITVEALEDWLRSDSELNDLLVNLLRTTSREMKLLYARCLRELIKDLSFEPRVEKRLAEVVGYYKDGLWAVRSSCVGEDDSGTTSPGIYGSLLKVKGEDVPEAVKSCLASWFSDRAVLYRFAQEQGDLPLVSVLLQPYCEGVGGVATINSFEGDLVVFIHQGVSAAEVTAGSLNTETMIFYPDRQDRNTLPDAEQEILKVLLKFYEYFGPVEIEWVRGPKHLIILQVKLIFPSQIEKDSWVDAKTTIHINHSNLAVVETILPDLEERVCLEVYGEINLEAFQGELIALICTYKDKIGEIRYNRSITPSSHFANICHCLGIKLITAQN